MLVFPEIFEACGCQFGIPNGVMNILVAEIGLQGAGVGAVISELEAAGVPKHMRVYQELEFGCDP